MQSLAPSTGRTDAAAFAARLNWLRAGVLGANDGIVSIAGLVFGVAGATTDHAALVIAGLAGMLAGALSMAGGEYVSVSSQRDTEVAALARQRRGANADPATVRAQLEQHYRDAGLPPDLASRIAGELSDRDAFDHHALTSLGIDPDAPTSPMAAARASLVAFVAGALIPLLAITLAPDAARLPSTLAAVCVALILTGWISARLGGAPVLPAVGRNLAVGSLTMALTFAAGTLVSGHLG